ncbi:MAG: DNA methylase [Anaerolineales bacterium]|nr:MAG: DNA methylase [Anaerolineales bacterium]
MALYDQPDLTEFIRKHATPYDPATDTYRRPPFAQPVKAGKNSPIYNAHSYHTKVPPEGIVPYIEHYTNPGDLVLDPFCGSGMTGVAALMTGRHAVLSDLSPAAVHIAYNYTTPVDVEALKREFERIKAAVKEEFDWLYGTTCDRCGGPATIQYTIWSDVFECARCGGEIVLWDEAVDPATGKVASKFSCPSCLAEWSKRQLTRIRSDMVLTVYECPTCSPTRGEHTTTVEERSHIASIEKRTISHWYPDVKVDAGREMMRHGLLKRGVNRTTDFYTRRNLWAISGLWVAIEQVSDEKLRAQLRFVVTAILHRATFLNRLRPSRAGDPLSGTLYIGAFTREDNVGLLLERKFKQVLKSLRYERGNSSVLVRQGSATDLGSVIDESVDYVFTDPPFGENIFYADCSILWESWLQDYTDESLEIVCNDRRVDGPFKTLQDYQDLMTISFREMYRVLKPGRWASVVFHNSDDHVWRAILDATEAAGFELAEINAFDKVQLSFKGIRGQKGLERVTNKDIVLNLHKPWPAQVPTPNGRTHLVEAEQRVVETVADFLGANPPHGQRTLQHLWNHVLYDLLRNGSVEVSMADVEAMLAHHSQTFKLVDGRYYLRGEAVMGGNVFDLRSDAGAIAWLTAVLSAEPQTTGELIPKWQQETARLGGVDPGRLDRLLEQNFWPDKRTGRWRVPTAAEREKMSARVDLSAQAHQRVVRRFLSGELDRRPADRELCAWIRFCYNREFYTEAAALFPHVNEAHVDPQEYRAVKRIASVCRMRSQQQKG